MLNGLVSMCGHYGKQMTGTRIIDENRSIVFAIKTISHGNKSSLINLHKYNSDLLDHGRSIMYK